MTEAAPRPARTITYWFGKPRPETLRLWSIQPLAVWERLQRTKNLYMELDQIEPDDSPILDCVWQYDWMREQMAQRLANYGGHYPWWAHFRSKPDLRRRIWEIEPSGSRFVRLELAIGAERVLLSNMDAWWNTVCERWYLPVDEDELQEWSAQLDQRGWLQSDWPLPEPWHSLRLASWERLFEVDVLSDGGMWENTVQGTFERLDLADVVAVTEFTARGRASDE